MQAVAEVKLESRRFQSHNHLINPLYPNYHPPHNSFTDAVSTIALVEPSQTNRVETVPSGTQHRVPSP